MTSFHVQELVYGPKAHAWTSIAEYLTDEAARAALDRIIADDVGLSRGTPVTDAHRRAYEGPPLRIVEVTARVLQQVGQAQ